MLIYRLIYNYVNSVIHLCTNAPDKLTLRPALILVLCVYVLLLQKDKAKDSEALRMTALLVVEDNWDFSDPEYGDYGDLGDDDSPLDLSDTNTEFPSATSSASPTVSSSGSGANSTPHTTPKVSWTPQTNSTPHITPKDSSTPHTLPSLFETSKLGSSNWGVLWGSRGGRGFGESRYKS